MPRDAPHVYRLDFVLFTTDAADAGGQTSFSLELEELHRGEILVGKNVALATSGAVPPASPRQDVGQRVKAQFRTRGDDLLLDVDLEMSALEPPNTVRKIVARGGALATPGKSTLVVSLENDRKRYELSVTPTKLR